MDIFTKHTSVTRSKYKQGFTLIEISIVIIIIGILLGGISLGYNLVHNSRLNEILSETERYRSAVVNFQDSYMSLPGDMANATAQWGAANAVPATCITTASTGEETCDGNGDGKIGPVSTGEEYERYRAWQHLTNAGLLRAEGFTGVEGSGGDNHAVPGNNVPLSVMGGAGYTLRYVGAFDNTDADFYQGIYSHILQFGRQTASSFTNGAIITPEEALELDNKADDGLPATGKIRSYKSTSTINTGCTTTDASTTAAYDITQGDAICSLIFITGF